MITSEPGTSPSFLSALEFAAYRHRFDKAKNDEPYINHVIKVCSLISVTGGINDPAVLTAAALHDILEKTTCKPNDISLQFGKKILNLVLELTDFNFANETDRWRQQMKKVEILSPEAKIIKLADKIANAEAVLLFPPQGWDIARRTIYLDWASGIIEALKGTNAGLENYFSELMIKDNGINQNDLLHNRVA